MTIYLTHAAFADHLNTTFRVLLDTPERVELELTELSELKITPNQERFAVVFRGSKEKFLGQGTRRLEHDKMGEFDIFIVPIKEDEGGVYYEASFNRLIEVT
jgi:Domain of unknown function (DUF6916)